MHKPLVDFLNHSLLPFVGRTEEIERGVSFWRSTLEGDQLRAALVLGEAGVGKSRYADQLIGEVARLGGTVIRVKLYPESASALAPLIAAALWDSEHPRRILGSEPDGTPPAVIAALRRLVRLRPTLLVIEDIHLLEKGSLAELYQILESLDDEILPLLCLARPTELSARSVLERYLAETIELHGLNHEEITQLWNAIFGNEAEADAVARLHEATGGNTLAIRSALRGALQSSAIVPLSSGEGKQVKIDASAFTAVLQHNISLLSEGMAVHLSERERDAAGKLATLGEVFAAETASVLLGDDTKELLNLLSFRGIVSHTVSVPSRLHGSASSSLPYTFTHTLLHRHLIEQAIVEPDQLLHLLAEELPLYSLLPLKIIGDHCDELTSSSEEIRGGIDRLLRIAQTLYTSTDYELAMDVWGVAEKLRDVAAKDLSSQERRELEIILLSARMMLNTRWMDTEEFASLVDEFLALTDAPLLKHLAEHRLLALRMKQSLWYRRNYPGHDAVVSANFIAEIEKFLKEFPALRSTEMFLNYLTSMSQAASADLGVDGMLRWIDAQLKSILESTEASEEFRTQALQEVGPFLLNLYYTPDEFETRLDLFRRLEGLAVAEKNMSVLYRRLMFMVETGHYDPKLAELIAQSIPHFRDHGLHSQASSIAVMRLRVLAALGYDLDEIHDAARQIITATPPRIVQPFLRFIGPHLIWIGLLRGDDKWMLSILDEFIPNESELGFDDLVLITAMRGELFTALQKIIDIPGETNLAWELARLVSGADRKAIASAARDTLRTPIVRATDTLTRRAVIALIELAEQQHSGLAKDLHDDIQFALTTMLETFVQRDAFAFMGPLLERYGKYLPAKDLKRWHSQVAEIARRCRAEQLAAGNDRKRLQLAMLGQIVARPADGEEIPIRGGRLRTVLGLLVADRMLRKPLEHREFCYIAAGSDDMLEPENARKTMNNAIFRLRELLGEETILTDGETPRLNDTAIQVDLLEADELLRQAEGNAREGALMRAVPALRRALEISRGEVPFPSLYEEFFEALREDFENRLRSTTIDIITKILRAGDPATAEELLRAALKAIPEDEELAELLHKSLTALGRQVEAKRLKIAETLVGN